MSQPRQYVSVEEAKPPFTVGIDVGGTNIKYGLVDDLGRTLAYDHIPTESKKGADDAIKRMAMATAEMVKKTGVGFELVSAVGLATPGTMDIPSGMLLEPPNLKEWGHFPIRDRLAEACGKPVAFENDANAAAFGEYWVGSGQQFNSMLLLTLGTGIGGGIILGGKVLDGENSHGGEVGHIIIDFGPDARMCACGKRGHLEAYASATAIVKRMEELLADPSRESSLRGRLTKCKKLSPLMLAEEAEKGDAFSLEVIHQTARYLGVGIVSLMHTIDPGGVVLGGAMDFGGEGSPLGNQFLDWIRQEVAERAFTVLAERTPIRFASLGGDAGYLGAAGIARAQFSAV